MIITRCKVFDSLLEGAASIGLFVAKIESSGVLDIYDSWTENARIENRYNNAVKVAFVVGILDGVLNIRNCSF